MNHTPKDDGRKAVDSRDHQRLVASFLRDHNFKPDVAPKELSCPSRQLVIQIFNFLLKEVDGTVILHSSNFEEEVARLMKCLCYPVALQKSVLKCPGTPTTWPCILHALVWLCELLTFEEDVMGDIRNDPNCPDPAFAPLAASQMEMEVLERISEAYGSFLRGEVNAFSVNEHLASFCQSKIKKSQEALCEARQTVTTKEADLEARRKILTYADAMVERNANLKKSLAELDTAQQDVEMQITERRDEEAALQRELDELLLKVENLETEKTRLQSRVEAQDVFKSEVASLVAKIGSKKSRRLECKRELGPLIDANQAREASNARLLTAVIEQGLHRSEGDQRLLADWKGLIPCEFLTKTKISVRSVSDVMRKAAEFASSEVTETTVADLASELAGASMEARERQEATLLQQADDLIRSLTEAHDQTKEQLAKTQLDLQLFQEQYSKVKGQTQSLEDAVESQQALLVKMVSTLEARADAFDKQMQLQMDSFSDEKQAWAERAATARLEQASASEHQQETLRVWTENLERLRRDCKRWLDGYLKALDRVKENTRATFLKASEELLAPYSC
ncbi:MAG: hypothetical protein KVP17_002985 [Porospora cf. gigantea B]|uniref:uncharacterized protein n=1 Tax=Porospora cf. gigantea B TaxID=2853592 RepID=UPI003571BE8B|nr:MAG: hypothetical protein KVP17_002985 [Porospora cf. gigantea B]